MRSFVNPGLDSSIELQGQGWACSYGEAVLFAYPPATVQALAFDVDENAFPM
jgi:hypothetical protein